jgi:hypothetical protein
LNSKLAWKLISIFRVWFQTFLGIEIAMHIKDIADGRFIWQVCLAAFIPVIIRWATPHDDFPDERSK